MKLGLYKKVLLTVMGVGVVGSLVSVGTFATFTATSTNPGNTFAAGTIKITTTAPGAGTVSAGDNIKASPVLGSGSGCTTVVASACGTLVAMTNVVINAGEGMQPGQYVRAPVTITNAGTLPALFSVQVQNIANKSGTDNTDCATDAGTVAGTTCTTKLGDALNITLDDLLVGAGTKQCVYGNGTQTGGVSNTAPTALLAIAGQCTDITAAADLTTANAGPKDPFSTTGTTSFLGGAATAAYIPGADTSSTSSPVVAKRWAPGEQHTITLTIALPDTGTTSLSNGIGSDTISVGNDLKIQGGSLSFDLVWLAQQ